VIKGFFRPLTLAMLCCISATYAVDENSSPDTSPLKKSSASEQQRSVSNLTAEQRTAFKNAGFTELRLILINVAQNGSLQKT
jgi:p-aminobenzoyl-glutamate transporter AbgT